MATVLGISGAWAELDASLREKQIEVSDPSELMQVRDTMRLRQRQGLNPLYQAFDDELQKSDVLLALATKNLAESIRRKTQPFLDEALRIERTLAHNRSRPWLLRYTTLLLPTLRLQRRKKKLYGQKE